MKTIQELLQFAAHKKIPAASFDLTTTRLSLIDGQSVNGFALKNPVDLKESISQVLGSKHMVFGNWKAQKQSFKGLGDVIFAWDGSVLNFFMPPEGMKAFKVWKELLASPSKASAQEEEKREEVNASPAEQTQHKKIVPINAAAATGTGIDSSYVHKKEELNIREEARWNGTLDGLLYLLVNGGGSDLHITAGLAPLYRVDGEIHSVGLPKIPAEKLKDMLYAVAPEANRKEFEETNDTDFAYAIPGLARFRVNLFMDRLGPSSVMRIIPEVIPSAEQLGLPKTILQFLKLSKGIVLVTGPTGSGKSTTLAAMIDWINANKLDHIITIEDPVEFVHPQKKCLINQREVGTHTESFSRALRAALREDPDIVLVGEMRDLETVGIALETAETGHLVFGTLHTNTAISTVDRIIDQFSAEQQSQIRMMLAESLKGVVTQTLCKKIGGGRVAAFEILVVDSAVSAMIRSGKSHMIENHMQTQKKAGNRLMNDSLTKLVEQGLITAEQAVSKSVEQKELAEHLQSLGYEVEFKEEFAA